MTVLSFKKWICSSLANIFLLVEFLFSKKLYRTVWHLIWERIGKLITFAL